MGLTGGAFLGAVTDVLHPDHLLTVELRGLNRHQTVGNQGRVLEGFQNLDLDQATNDAGEGVDVEERAGIETETSRLNQGPLVASVAIRFHHGTGSGVLTHRTGIWAEKLPPARPDDRLGQFLEAEVFGTQGPILQHQIPGEVAVLVAVLVAKAKTLAHFGQETPATIGLLGAGLKQVTKLDHIHCSGSPLLVRVRRRWCCCSQRSCRATTARST